MYHTHGHCRDFFIFRMPVARCRCWVEHSAYIPCGVLYLYVVWMTTVCILWYSYIRTRTSILYIQNHSTKSTQYSWLYQRSSLPALWTANHYPPLVRGFMPMPNQSPDGWGRGGGLCLESSTRLLHWNIYITNIVQK
jgi:hypothetical protein